jgi:hypothetical protein
MITTDPRVGPDPRTWLVDDRGAIMVIAIFMSAVIVGAIWYTLGLGEAMIYREQMRAAADATAFDAATVHALGMNMVSMINVTMAAILAILLAVTVFLMICIGVTVLAIACAAIPFFGLACDAAVPELVAFDKEVWDVCVTLRKIIFGPSLNIPGVLPVLNWTEGMVGVVVPWGANFESRRVAEGYPGAVVRSGMISPSMYPTRFPILGNYLDISINNWYKNLPRSLPSLKDKIPEGNRESLKKASGYLQTVMGESKLRVTDLQRYGLPIQSDKFNILCDHAGNELVQMLAYVIGEVFGNEGEAFVNNPVTRRVGSLFGLVVGSAPGLFCTGGDPIAMLTDAIRKIPVIGDRAANKVQNFFQSHFGDLNGGTPTPIFDPTVTPDPFGDPKPDNPTPGVKGFIKDNWPKVIDESITSMKVFDLAKNGNDWFAVYSTVIGDPGLTAGAQTGVEVASWLPGEGSPSAIGQGEGADGSQAEFYFDCGNTATNGDDEGITALFGGGSDMSASWSSCKYAALWNMRWRARLRRLHPFDLNVGDEIGILLYNLTGIEGGMQKVFSAFEVGGGAEVKLAGLDRLKSDFEKFIDWVMPNGGKVQVGDSPPSGTYH